MNGYQIPSCKLLEVWYVNSMSFPDSSKPPRSLEGVRNFLEQQLAHHLPEAVVSEVMPITPDASLRRYYRVNFKQAVLIPALGEGPEVGASVSTAVAMIFDAVASPEATGNSIGSDESYVSLSAFFRANNVAVPALYVDARKDSMLLIEDLGDRALIDLVREAEAQDRPSLLSTFEGAIREIARIQSIPKNHEYFAFRRTFDKATYVREMEEFRDFCLAPKTPAESVVEVTNALFDFLGDTLNTLERVLVHRDFHAWNVLVDSKSAVRIIDFQDALMATRPYDVVSLLNDRDMDSLLGPELYHSLVLTAASTLTSSVDDRARFLWEYDRVLLQRDLKVSGRFAKLVQVRGLLQYGKWIPGTLRRIGRTLERIIAQGEPYPAYDSFLTAVSPLFEEIRQGYEDPLRF